ncbi:unnamed protein product, partial [Tetraodon nigroviridis]
VCGCCGPLRPRYKRLVDNIFPEDPKDGLSKSDMEKLTFYAVSAPEKLDRIGEYLAKRLSHDVALDQLLMACHSQSIKPFVESFLHMVAKLLESREPDLQVLGTNSFVKFANIEEDTPSYHRRYDFFVSQFSAMCHSTHEDPETMTRSGLRLGLGLGSLLTSLAANVRIRVAGIRGLQGVVRKTVNDELQAIIWEPQHMDKLIPSMLFNMQDGEDMDRAGHPSTPSVAGQDGEENPATLAENCFRELLGRAAYGNMNNAVRPVLVHLDNHHLWEPNEFAVSCFRIIMYSIQAQHSHHVIQQVLNHLDTHSRDPPRVRAGIVQVLLETVAIAAKGSVAGVLGNHSDGRRTQRPVDARRAEVCPPEDGVRQEHLGGPAGGVVVSPGPTVLEVFNTLLKHLRVSVDLELGDGSRRNSAASVSSARRESEERIVQNAIIQTIGFFGGNLPDYQRAEVMMFIMGKVPVFGTPCHTLDTVKIEVTSGFKSKSMAAALPPSFLDPLFSISLMEDGELRQLVLEILHNIIDRHDNRAKLRGIRIIPNVAALKIKREKITKQDVAFMKKHGQQLYRHIYLGCKEEDNVHKNFELLFTTLAILTIELANEDAIVDLIRLAVALQEMALANEENLPMFNRCGVMALVAAYLNFLSQMVIELRSMRAPYLLPEHIFRDKCAVSPLPDSLEKDDQLLLFQSTDMAECLAGPGYNVEKLSIPYVPQVTVLYTVGKILHRCKQTSRDEDRLTRRKSFVDTVSLQVDIMSSSLPDKSQLAEEITFETLKKAIDTTGLEEQERERRRQVMEKFQKAPFEELAAHCESKANLLHDRLARIFELTIRSGDPHRLAPEPPALANMCRPPRRPPPSPSGTVSLSAGHGQHQSVPVYEMKFPDLCVY